MAFEEETVTVIHKKDSFGYHLQDRLERAIVEMWSPGSGQGRDSSMGEHRLDLSRLVGRGGGGG